MTATSNLPAPEIGSARHFLETEYIPQRMIDATEETKQNARRSWRYMFMHFGRDVRLDELSDSLVANHMAWLKSERGLRPASINGHRGAILMVWRFAAEQRLITTWPHVRKMKAWLHEPDSWSAEEIAKLVKATAVMREHRQWPGPVPLDAFWRCVLLVEWWTGVRIGSLLCIRRADIDREKRTIYFQPETMKNRHGKLFFVGADAVDAIRDIWQPKRELLLPWPLARDALWRQFRKLQAAAGLRHNGRSTSRLHKIRRSVATQAAVSGGKQCAIALMDHSSANVTARYIDPTRLPAMDATEFLPKLPDLS